MTVYVMLCLDFMPLQVRIRKHPTELFKEIGVLRGVAAGKMRCSRKQYIACWKNEVF